MYKYISVVKYCLLIIEIGKGHRNHLGTTEGGCPKRGSLARCYCSPMLLKGATWNKLKLLIIEMQC